MRILSGVSERCANVNFKAYWADSAASLEVRVPDQADSSMFTGGTAASTMLLPDTDNRCLGVEALLLTGAVLCGEGALPFHDGDARGDFPSSSWS